MIHLQGGRRKGGQALPAAEKLPPAPGIARQLAADRGEDAMRAILKECPVAVVGAQYGQAGLPRLEACGSGRQCQDVLPVAHPERTAGVLEELAPRAGRNPLRRAPNGERAMAESAGNTDGV